ncbi:MAG: IS982 family transposase [Acidobacteriota bacterium]|nr:IS982 family transposase [Acidobacteriota bacterium]MDQ5836058.1 IS982 family transposase [Acidobacteriota bacterium]
MDLDTLIVTAFCLVDDALTAALAGRRLRRRGPQPVLSDAEVLTMELVGEFLGLDCERQMFDYFRRHYPHFFPALRSLHRTTFTRQAANLWQVKARLWQGLLRGLQLDRAVSLVDSFPLPVCRFARAKRCRRLRELSAYGYDEVAKQTFLGVRVHLRVCWPGLVVGFEVAPANVHEMRAAEDLLEGARGCALGDRNYWSPALSEQFRAAGLLLLAPFRKASREPKPWPRRLVNTRRRIETVIGQLVGRFHARQVWARDPWHFYSRLLRKVLGHTLFVGLCQQYELLPLRMAELLTD